MAVALTLGVWAGCSGGLPRTAASGDYLVGVDLAEGVYMTVPGANYRCRWKLTRGDRSLYNMKGLGPVAVLNLLAGDRFETEGCGEWGWARPARSNAVLLED